MAINYIVQPLMPYKSREDVIAHLDSLPFEAISPLMIICTNEEEVFRSGLDKSRDLFVRGGNPALPTQLSRPIKL